MKKETGKVIKAIRQHWGYKQEYVAQKLNITSKALGHIENGRAELGIERLCRLAAVYKVLPRQILEISIEIHQNKSDKGLEGAVGYIVRL